MHGSGTRTYKERDPKTLGRDPRIQGSKTGAYKGAKPAHTRVRAGANPGARPAFTQGRDQRKHGSEARTHPGRDPRKRWSWTRTYEGSETVPAQTRERDRRIQRARQDYGPQMHGGETSTYEGARPVRTRERNLHIQGCEPAQTQARGPHLHRGETSANTGARPAHTRGETRANAGAGPARTRGARQYRRKHGSETGAYKGARQNHGPQMHGGETGTCKGARPANTQELDRHIQRGERHVHRTRD